MMKIRDIIALIGFKLGLKLHRASYKTMFQEQILFLNENELKLNEYGSELAGLIEHNAALTMDVAAKEDELFILRGGDKTVVYTESDDNLATILDNMEVKEIEAKPKKRTRRKSKKQ